MAEVEKQPAEETTEAVLQESGIKMLIEKNSSSQTRLPMLEVIFDRFVRLLSSSYRSFTSFTVDVEVEKSGYVKFGEYIDSLPLPSMLGVVRAIEWDNMALLSIDSALTYGLVDILLGGRKVDSNIKVEGRPYTVIEQTMVQSIIEIFLNDLSVSFEAVAPITFQLERLETHPKFATITRAEDLVALLRLQVRMDSRSGCIELVIPYATLEPVKKLLQKSFVGERGGKDPAWVRHIEHEVYNTSVMLDVKLNGITSTVKDLASLQVGNTIILDKEPGDDIFVTVGDFKISSGTIGRVDGNVAVRLSEPIHVVRYSEAK